MLHKRHNPGFTLIEIMVAVAVIVVLSGVIWKMGFGLETQGRVQRQKEAFAILDSALQEYYEVKGVFPEVVIDDDLEELLLFQARTQSMWQQLLAVPESRFVAERLSRSLLKDLYRSSDATDDEKANRWPEIYDVWDQPVEYVWHADMAFPVLRSYGPNKALNDPNDLSDDVTNR